MGNVKVYDFRTQQQKEEAYLINTMNEHIDALETEDKDIFIETDEIPQSVARKHAQCDKNNMYANACKPITKEELKQCLADTKELIDHMPQCTTEREEEKRELTSEDVKFKECEREKARMELREQEKQNPPIRHKDSPNSNPDLNAKDDVIPVEIINETLKKQRGLFDEIDTDRLKNAIINTKKTKQEDNRPVTEKIKEIVDFKEAKKMMHDMDAIYADAEVNNPNPDTDTNFNFNSNIRDFNIGTSDYSQHKIQPWDIWEDYNLNPWDADIVKRVLRKKELPGLDNNDSRIEDYQKIIHICLKRIDQIKKGTNIT